MGVRTVKGCVYGLSKGIESGKGLFVPYNGRGCLAALFLCYAACKNTISLSKTVYYGVMISGFLGGVGGAVYAQSISNNFAVTTIAGPGFIALAAMIFGRWNPVGAMLSSLFFGLSQSLAIIGKQLPVISHVPNVYLQIAPYILTIIVLAAFFGKSVAPKADGVNYIKSK